MGKRGPQPGPPKGKKLISLHQTTLANIDKEAKRRGITSASLLAQAIENKWGGKK